jgi:hypothetical protein
LTAHITTTQVQTWLESTKLTVTSLDAGLEAQVSSEVLGKLTETYASFVPLWIDATTTPAIVQKVMSMIYAGWLFDRSYSEVISEQRGASYGLTLRTWGTQLLNDIISGAVSIAEIAPNQPAVAPVFYPTDTSSTWDAWRMNTDCNDNSLGPAKFGMGKVF